jgi:WASH complex subunit strumpellin
MIKLVNIKKSTLTHIEIISDITWSWIVLKDYTKLMQKEIRKSPGIALLLKNTFMKLSSILNIPMVRLLMAESPDIDSVSKFYSNELIRIVKDVLQIIPELVFENLDSIITIFLTRMKNEPHKFDKAELNRYSQFDERLEIAKLTNEISVFAESILNMETYLIGVIEVNPKEVLEAGVRKELIKLIAIILEKSLRVPTKTPEEFFAKIVRLSDKLNSFKMSLEYIQDFIHIHGLKMFYEEFERLIYAYVDIEKLYLITKETGFEELNYDESIPMPKGEYSNCNSFFGEILNEIIALTHPSRCTFLQAAYGFFNLDTKKEVLTLKTLHVLAKCVGISGMQGLDYLLSMKIMDKLKLVIKALNKVCNE